MMTFTYAISLLPIYIYFLHPQRGTADDYHVVISTSDTVHAGTLNPVFMRIGGNNGTISEFQLQNYFPRGSTEWILARGKPNVGIVCSMTLRLVGGDGWMIDKVIVIHSGTRTGRMFTVNAEIDDDANITKTIKVDGEYTAFGEWSPCEAGCNATATQIRRRSCTDPKPGCGGQQCRGPDTERRTCQGPPCPTTSTTTTTTTPTTTSSTTSTTTPSTTTTTTTTPTIITTSFATPKTSVREVVSKDPREAVISLGIVLSLSVILSVILTAFLIVVLRHKHADKKSQSASLQPDVNLAEDGDSLYVNSAMLVDKT